MQQPSSMPYREHMKRSWTQASETPGTSWQSMIPPVYMSFQRMAHGTAKAGYIQHLEAPGQLNT